MTTMRSPPNAQNGIINLLIDDYYALECEYRTRHPMSFPRFFFVVVPALKENYSCEVFSAPFLDPAGLIERNKTRGVKGAQLWLKK